MISKHYKNKRRKREKFIDKYIHDDGKVIDEFVVNKGHKHGVELHQLTDSGIIIIKNLNSGKLVTKLIAREKQLQRYYLSTGKTPPSQYEKVLYMARWHESLNYHHV